MDYLEQLKARKAAGEFDKPARIRTGCDYLDKIIAAQENKSKKDQDSGEVELSLELKPKKGLDLGL